MLDKIFFNTVKKAGLAILSLMILFSMNGLVFAYDDFGSQGALDRESFTLEQMLHYAIEDEYTALAEYQLIMEAYDVTRPFSNIAKAEETHIEWLLPLFESYGIEVPENNVSEHIVLPDSLAESYEIGVTAEINNIAMYEVFLNQDIPDDVAVIFEALRNASENHLAAFSNQIDRVGNTRQSNGGTAQNQMSTTNKQSTNGRFRNNQYNGNGRGYGVGVNRSYRLGNGYGSGACLMD